MCPIGHCPTVCSDQVRCLVKCVQFRCDLKNHINFFKKKFNFKYLLSTRTPHQIRPLIRSDFSTYTEIMCSSYLHHHPPKWLLFSALLLCLIVLSDQASTCSTVGQLKCKCINLTTFNCSWASINIMPIMLDPRLKVLDLSHNQIKRIHDLNSIYISIEHLDISYNLLNSNESSMFESKNLKVGFSCFKKRVAHFFIHCVIYLGYLPLCVFD